MTKLLIPYSSQLIETGGYNMSVIVHPTCSDNYLASLRKIEVLSYSEYPNVKSTTYLLELDERFMIRSSKKLVEPQRSIFVSYTTGLEDCRLIDNTYFTGVLMDSNDKWLATMCLGKYDSSTGEIKKMICLENEDNTHQKNWLVINQTSTHMTILHSYDPLKVISVEKETGKLHTLHYQKVFHLEDCEMHGGGCVYLYGHKKYLVNVRVVRAHCYQYSLWLLFNEKYKILGSSDPFRFLPKGENSTRHYEMCMSIIDKDDFILASVSLNDKETHMLKYKIKDIIASISVKDTIQTSH
jgi:hypothetical protein